MRKTAASSKAGKAAETTSLSKYHAKRDFKKTAEPEGAPVAGEAYGYVIQKHVASRLHFDFRLQLDGTLKSWAVPKGPSYDPHDKRLAMQVEDHPVEYATFEGTIPQGEYGGGTVMVWDRGTWEPVGDPRAGLIAGKLVFRLHGGRLQGEWTLVRTHGKFGAAKDAANAEPGRSWLLLKHRDEYVREGDAGAFVASQLTSIVSGRTMEEIAAGAAPKGNEAKQKTAPIKARAAKSAKTAGSQPVTNTIAAEDAPSAKSAKRKSPAKAVSEARHGSDGRDVVDATADVGNAAADNTTQFPGFIEPQLATLTDAVPKNAGWVHELKFDGYRMLTYIEDGEARMLSRNAKDWTDSFPTIVAAAGKLKIENAILDGEVVCMDEHDHSNFSQLKDALSDGQTDRLRYYIFDVLFLNGVDVRQQPLSERKALLAELLATMPRSAKNTLALSASLTEDAETVFARVCEMQLEGIISKRADDAYSSGRSGSWLKIKCIKRQEFVVAGFTLPTNGSDGVGALLLSYFEDGVLQYAGRVGTGWNAATSVRLRKMLEKLQIDECPLAEIEPAARRLARWVQPSLVCEVQFTEWTPDGHLRHPSFQGLREDKPAADVRREVAKPLGQIADVPKVAKRATAPQATHTTQATRTAKTTKAATAKKKTTAAEVITEKKNAKTPEAKTGSEKPTDQRSVVSAAAQRGTGSTVGGVQITHPDRIIFVDQQISKVQLADYYLSVADYMLPHIIQRPISVLRCPSGADEKCFFQRHLGLGSSPHLHELRVPIKGVEEEYLQIEDVQGLVSLVQWGVIEIHPWQCTAKKLDKPDRLIFDLDPAEDVSWKALVEGALEVRARMSELGMTSFVKTTGGKGLHIVVPMTPVFEWEAMKSFARLIAQSMESDSPGKYVSRMTKAARTGRIYVDYLRNENTATAVAPFSVRARPGAPVSTPLDWRELTPKFDISALTMKTVPARLKKLKADPWADFFEIKQRIEKKYLRALDVL